MLPAALCTIFLLALWTGCNAQARDRAAYGEFSWKAGEWGVCWSEQGCGLGIEERTVWCADAKGRPLPPSLCTGQERPQNSRSCYTTCSESTWQVDSWSPCQVGADRARDAEGQCHGLRKRTVTCQVQGTGAPSDHCPHPPPSREVSCVTTCPQDCVVGPWSTWAPCGSCSTSQRRTRTVVVAPTPEGSPCPPLSESRPCLEECIPSEASLSTSAERKDLLVRLRVGEWGPCQATHTLAYNTIENTLKDTPKEDNSIYFTREEKDTFPEVGVVDTDEDTMAGSNMEAEVAGVAARLWMVEQTPLPLPQPTDWEAAAATSLPRVGRQERSLTCVHANGTRLPLSMCLAGRSKVAERVRTCVVDRDCTVTQWSSWSTVVPGCVAPSGLVVREVRERHRTSPSLQHGDGVPCPHLLERHTLPDPSLQPCDTRYQWVSSAWGACMGQEGVPVTCGGGVQARDLTCVRAADHVPVKDELCVHVEPPPRVQRCEVGCERDCLVGPWSAWGICTPTDCTASPPPATPGFRRRRRQVVVTPSPGGAECPPLEEQSECHEAQCHQWVMGSWSPCRLTNSAHFCGVGLQSRNASCLDSAGAPAPMVECEGELGAAPKSQECYVPCSYDCVTGSWSPWSPCSRPCASQLHVGYTQRNTSVVAPPGPGGKRCPPPDELTQVETCRVEPCGGAAWVPGTWGRCSLPSRAACGPGRQTRHLYCRDHQNNTVPSYRCSGMSRPDLERQCEVSCGTACTVTSWSEWSPCLAPDPCPMDGVLVASAQRRWRRVLVEARDGGEPCPLLKEERGCAHAPVTCTTHHWRTGPWSRCNLAEDVECGIGFRVRKVECVDAVDQVVEPTNCLLGKTIVPDSSVECHVECARACVLSSWTPWTPCPIRPPCGTPSVRERQLLDGSEKNPQCLNITLRKSEECPCHDFYSTPAGSWSSCLVGELQSDKEASKREGTVKVSGPREEAGLCGVGRRYQALLCMRDDGVLAHPSSCNHAGVKEEPCMVECPSDCRMGPWGSWSTCNASCGAGIQYRTRQVLEPSLWGGRPCPEANQSRACWGPCSSAWMPGGWSECLVSDDKDCGAGTQTRSVRCMTKTLTGLQQEVFQDECDVSLKPPTQQTCHVSCPGQCVVSSWSPWSPCPTGCSEHTRSRTREVVRRPMGSVAPCPPLREEEPCVLNVSCWEYTWQMGNWTSCVPLGHSSCGEGVRNRPVTCLRSDGVAAPEWKCPRDTRPSPIETWCYVDCPIDCEVTAWTVWDDSKCSCGENPGEMTRRRFLSVNPSESGRPCPTLLQDTRPCPAIPCYTWERGPWSQCHLQGGSCGHGYVERNVSCVGPGGQTVDPKLCLALVHVGGHTWPYLARALDLNTMDGCYVPCKGDCELTEWAPWSHCHRDCSRGHQGGTQARSRAVLTEGTSGWDAGRGSCPGPLWETRPCLAGPCLNFTWQILNGTVQCVRSDGLVVTGGCEGEPRPCLPECMVRGSLCSAVGACVCRPGLRPFYSEKQRFHLSSCIPVRNITFPLPQPFSAVKYLPEDINVWMFAMVGVGSAFVVFVVISVYLLCQSPREQTTTPVTLRRQKNLRHRAV